MLVSVGEEEGVLEETEREMIHGIFEMGDMRIREVMVPRTDLVAIEVGHSITEAIDLVTRHGHTRIPLYEGSLDNIVGILYAKDLLKAVNQHTQISLRDLARKPYFTPESNKVQDVLRDLRKNRVHMAIVVDEFGGTAGAVTIEDILEEIVGPIKDEYDVGEEDEIQFVSPNEVVLDGKVSVDDVNELLKLKIAADAFDTIGGYVLSQLGASPRVGATLPIGEATLKVEAVRGTRIKKVRIRSETPFEIPQAEQGEPTLTSTPPQRGADSQPRR
jgi:CBS domain containing-hemolysin-like protein